MAEEQQLLAEGEVRVTTHRITIGDTMYVVANITSVKRGKESDASTIATILGVLGVLLGVSMAFGLGLSGSLDVGLGCGGAALLVGVLFLLIGSLSKPAHWLKFNTSGVETQALSSKDAAFVGRVADAAQRAIASR